MKNKKIDSSYAGYILYVDLSKGSCWKEELDTELKEKFVGGIGFNATLAYDLIKPDIDPLSQENILFIGAGALSGTSALGTPKTEIVGKSPQSGTIGTALAGHFGTALKCAGYDELVIMGRADRPVYLKIFDDDVEVCDGRELWGRDIYEATEALYNKFKPRECAVTCIGPAGENLVTHALILNDKVSTWGWAGFGAVFGSKNLKAIVCHGTKGVSVADPQRFEKLVDDATKLFMADPSREIWTKYGTMVSWEPYAKMGNLSYRNWEAIYPPEEAVRLYGLDAFWEHKIGVVSCISCPSGCKAKISVRGGEFAGLEHYTSCNLGGALEFGIKGEAGDYGRVYRCYNLANRYGIEHMTMVGKIAFLVEIFGKGLIGGDVTDGLELRYDFETFIELMRRTAYREGKLWNLLAGSWDELIATIGGDAEKYAVVVRGMDPPFEPRVNLGTENLGIFTCPRGGHPTMALSLTVVPGRSRDSLERYCQGVIGVPEEGRSYCPRSRTCPFWLVPSPQGPSPPLSAGAWMRTWTGPRSSATRQGASTIGWWRSTALRVGNPRCAAM